MLKLFITTLLMTTSFNLFAQTTKLCTYQLFSYRNGQVLQTYKDSNCYTAQSYCNEAMQSYSSQTTTYDIAYSVACKTPEERVYAGSASYSMYYKGVLQTRVYAQHYDLSQLSADSSADHIAWNKCHDQIELYAKKSSDPNYNWDASCSKN